MNIADDARNDVGSILQNAILNDLIQNGFQETADTVEFSLPKPYAEKVKLNWSPDFTLATFNIARSLRNNPIHLANEVAHVIERLEYISKSESIGPYINFSVNDEFITALLSRVLHPQRANNKEAREIVIDVGLPSLGTQLSASQNLLIFYASVLNTLAERYGGNTSVLLRVDDWGYPSASLVAAQLQSMGSESKPLSHFENAALQLPARKLRQVQLLLQSGNMPESKIYEGLRDEWVSHLLESPVFSTLPGLKVIGNSEVHTQALQVLLELPKLAPQLFLKDKDSSAITTNSEQPVALVTHDGEPTLAGYDLAGILANGDKECICYLRTDKSSLTNEVVRLTMVAVGFTLTTIVMPDLKRLAVISEKELSLYKLGSRLLNADAVAEVQLQVGQLLKSTNAFDHDQPNEFTYEDKRLAFKLFTYENVLRDSVDRMTLEPVQDYISTLIQPTAHYLSTLLAQGRIKPEEELILKALASVTSDIMSLINISENQAKRSEA